jgi:hypothetical protein
VRLVNLRGTNRVKIVVYVGDWSSSSHRAGREDLMESQSLCDVVMAVLRNKRVESALEGQKVLTKHGCLIRVRLGLHETSKAYCAEDGLILLHLCG